jgi:hypothetical protein
MDRGKVSRLSDCGGNIESRFTKDEQNELFGGLDPVSEKQNQSFQLSLNPSLRIDFQGSRVTSDGGQLLGARVG